jgi:catechol 2,3-dioxygenase-like lactoylglutathione lyase family enzyme
MKIKLTSIYVDDQDKALRFYTDVLGFVKKADFSQGPFRWLTVASPEEPSGTELQSGAEHNPAAKSVPGRPCCNRASRAAMFFTDDVKDDYQRIKDARRRIHDATHRGDRLDHCDANDTCGNLIQISQLALR